MTCLKYVPIYQRKEHRPEAATKMPQKKSVGDLTASDLHGKKVFMRVDFDGPLMDNQGITDFSRLEATVPTIKYLTDRGARVILCGSLVQHKKDCVTSICSLKCFIPKLSELIQGFVRMAPNCIGDAVLQMVAEIPDGGVLLLQNVRAHKGESDNSSEFAEKLASLADLYVNDAFCTTVFAHASTVGVPNLLKPAVAGLRMKKELEYLVETLSHPKRPFAAILCASKLSTMRRVIVTLLDKVDILLLGGPMIFTFWKAQGFNIGSSLVEEQMCGPARSIIQLAALKKVELVIPLDVVLRRVAPHDEIKNATVASIPDGWTGVDIGSNSLEMFTSSLATAKTIIWIGAMGGMNGWSSGTQKIAEHLADLTDKGATTIIAAGVSRLDLQSRGLDRRISHISRGGRAVLALLEGRLLPGLLALDDNTGAADSIDIKADGGNDGGEDVQGFAKQEKIS